MKDRNDSSNSDNRRGLVPAKSRNLDLGIRAELGQELRAIMLNKKMKQRELAALLNVQQPEVSHLFNRHFDRFTIDKLVQFFERLGWGVQFTIHRYDDGAVDAEAIAPE